MSEKKSSNNENQGISLNDFLRDRLWYRAEQANIIRKADKLKEYDEVVRELMLAVQIDTSMSRDEIILKIYDFLVEKKTDDRNIALILGLVDGALAEVEDALLLKDDTHATLKIDRADYREMRHEDPSDKIAKEELDAINRQIKDLTKGTIEDVIRVISEVGGAEIIFRPIAPFEGAYIREEVRHRPKGNQVVWEAFVQKAMQMFDLKEGQIRSAGAWHEEALRAKGGPRVGTLITALKKKACRVIDDEKNKESGPDTPKQEKEKSKNLPTRPRELLDPLYNFWPDGSKHAEFVRKFEPADYTLEQGDVPQAYKPWILAAVGVEPDDDRKKMIRKFLAEHVFGVSVHKISAITAYLTGGCKAKLKGERAEAVKRIEGFLAQDNEAPVFPEPEFIEASNGAIEDYENETKEKWRQKWFDFIAENTQPNQRKKMKVLCLPGRKCIEAKGYIELGFKPENIIAVERDPGIRGEFEANARALGIKTKFGDLADILPAMKEPLDMVALDFHGQIYMGAVKDILSQTLLNEKALVMVNFMAKRENSRIQNELKYFAGRSQKAEDALATASDSDTLLDLMHTAEKGAGELIEDDSVELGEIRAEALYSLICYVIGSNRDEFWRKKHRMSKVTEYAEVVSAYVDAFDTESGYKPKNINQPRHIFTITSGNSTVVVDELVRFMKAINFQFTYDDDDGVTQDGSMFKLGLMIKELCYLVAFKPIRPTQAKLVRYESESKSHPAYISTFMSMERDSDFLNKLTTTSDFLLRVLFDYFEQEGIRDFYLLTKKGKKPLRIPMGYKISDYICYRLVSGRVIKIKMSQMFSDLKRFIAHDKDKFISQNTAPEVEEL